MQRRSIRHRLGDLMDAHDLRVKGHIRVIVDHLHHCHFRDALHCADCLLNHVNTTATLDA